MCSSCAALKNTPENVGLIGNNDDNRLFKPKTEVQKTQFLFKLILKHQIWVSLDAQWRAEQLLLQHHVAKCSSWSTKSFQNSSTIPMESRRRYGQEKHTFLPNSVSHRTPNFSISSFCCMNSEITHFEKQKNFTISTRRNFFLPCNVCPELESHP